MCLLAEPVTNPADKPEKVLGFNACSSITGDPAAGDRTGVSVSLGQGIGHLMRQSQVTHRAKQSRRRTVTEHWLHVSAELAAHRVLEDN